MSRVALLRNAILAALHLPVGGLPIPPLLELVLEYALPATHVRTLIASPSSQRPKTIVPIHGENVAAISPGYICYYGDGGKQLLLLASGACINALNIATGECKPFAAGCLQPRGMCVNPIDNSVLFSDSQTIRRVHRGRVMTIAGGERGFADGSGTDALFFHPVAICCSSDGKHAYVSDSFNHRIRQLTLPPAVATSDDSDDYWQNAEVKTVGGDGTEDDRSARAIPFPFSLAFDSPDAAAGVNLYVRSRGVIRVLDLLTGNASTLNVNAPERFFVGAFVFVARYLIAAFDMTTSGIYVIDTRSGDVELMCGGRDVWWADGPFGSAAVAVGTGTVGLETNDSRVTFGGLTSLAVGPAPVSVTEYEESGSVLYASDNSNECLRTIDLPPKLDTT